METDVCQVVLINGKNVDLAASRMPAETDLIQMAETFRLLGEPTRLRILFALTSAELCVCDLSTLLEASASAVSHQLRLLRTSGLVNYRRDGKVVYYSLKGDSVRQLLMGIASVQPDAE